MSNPIETLRNLSEVNGKSDINKVDEFLDSDIDFELINYKDNCRDLLLKLTSQFYGENINTFRGLSRNKKGNFIEKVLIDRYLLKEGFIGLVKSTKDIPRYFNSLMEFHSNLFSEFELYKDLKYNCLFNDFNPVISTNVYDYYSKEIIINLNDNMYTEILDNFKYYNTYIKEGNNKKLLISTVGSNLLIDEFNKYVKYLNPVEKLLYQSIISSDLLLHYSCNDDIFSLFINNIDKFDKLKIYDFEGNLFSRSIEGIKLIYLGHTTEYIECCVNYIKDKYKNDKIVYNLLESEAGYFINLIELKNYKLDMLTIESLLYQDSVYNYIKSAYSRLLKFINSDKFIEDIYEEAIKYSEEIYDINRY